MQKNTGTSSESFLHPWKPLHPTRRSGADSAIPVAQSRLRFAPCQLTLAMLGGVTGRLTGRGGEGLLRAAVRRVHGTPAADAENRAGGALIGRACAL